MNRRISFDNRLCYEREILRQQAIHRDKVKHCVPTCQSPSKAVVNSHGPSHGPNHGQHVVKPNYKRQQMEKDRQMEIYKQNQWLAHKMNQILHRQERLLLGNTLAKPRPPMASPMATEVVVSVPLSPCHELSLEEINEDQQQPAPTTVPERLEDPPDHEEANGDTDLTIATSPIPMLTPVQPRSVLVTCCDARIQSPQSPLRVAHVHCPGIRLDANQMPIVDCHLALETSLGRGNATKKTTLVNKGVQRRKLERIEEENRKMLQRIRSQKPHYTLRKWDRQYDEVTKKHQHLHSDGTVGYLLPRTSHGSRTTWTRSPGCMPSPVHGGASTSREQREQQRNEWNSNTNIQDTSPMAPTTNRDARLKAKQIKIRNGNGSSKEAVSTGGNANANGNAPKQPTVARRTPGTSQRPGKRTTNRLDQRLQQARSDAAQLEQKQQHHPQHAQVMTVTAPDEDDDEFQVVQTTAVTLLEARTTRSIDLVVQEIQIEVNYKPLHASSTRGDRGLLIHATLNQMVGQCLVSMTTLQEIAQLLDDLEIMIKLETINCYAIGNFPRLSEVLTEDELQRLVLSLVRNTHIEAQERTGKLCLYQRRPFQQQPPPGGSLNHTNTINATGEGNNKEEPNPRNESGVDDNSENQVPSKKRPTTCPSCSSKTDIFASATSTTPAPLSPHSPPSPSSSSAPSRPRAAATDSVAVTTNGTDLGSATTSCSSGGITVHTNPSTNPTLDPRADPLRTTTTTTPAIDLATTSVKYPEVDHVDQVDHAINPDSVHTKTCVAEVLDVEEMQRTLTQFSDLINCHRRCTRKLPTGSFVVCTHFFDTTPYRLEQQVLNISNSNFYKQTKQFSWEEIHKWLHKADEPFDRARWLQRFEKDFMDRIVQLEEDQPVNVKSTSPRLTGNFVEILAFDDQAGD